MRKIFYEGQPVTLKKVTNTWFAQNNTVSMNKNTAHGYGPKPGEVVHVGVFMFDDEWWMTIKEYPGIAPVVYWYAQSEFAPVISSEVLEKELSEIFSDEIAGVK